MNDSVVSIDDIVETAGSFVTILLERAVTQGDEYREKEKIYDLVRKLGDSYYDPTDPNQPPLRLSDFGSEIRKYISALPRRSRSYVNTRLRELVQEALSRYEPNSEKEVLQAQQRLTGKKDSDNIRSIFETAIFRLVKVRKGNLSSLDYFRDLFDLSEEYARQGTQYTPLELLGNKKAYLAADLKQRFEWYIKQNETRLGHAPYTPHLETALKHAAFAITHHDVELGDFLGFLQQLDGSMKGKNSTARFEKIQEIDGYAQKFFDYSPSLTS